MVKSRIRWCIHGVFRASVWRYTTYKCGSRVCVHAQDMHLCNSLDGNVKLIGWLTEQSTFDLNFTRGDSSPDPIFSGMTRDTIRTYEVQWPERTDIGSVCDVMWCDVMWCDVMSVWVCVRACARACVGVTEREEIEGVCTLCISVCLCVSTCFYRPTCVCGNGLTLRVV